MTSRSKNLDYYFNKKTGKQYWVDKDLPVGWSHIIEQDHRTYYFHISDEKGTRTYDKPTVAAAEVQSPRRPRIPSIDQEDVVEPPRSQRRGSNSLHDLLSPVGGPSSDDDRSNRSKRDRDDDGFRGYDDDERRPSKPAAYEDDRSRGSKRDRYDDDEDDRRSSKRPANESSPRRRDSRDQGRYDPVTDDAMRSRGYGRSSSLQRDNSAVVPKSDQQQAAHFYSNLERNKTSDRTDSLLYHMRCMNNWVKSVLIQEYSQKRSRVLDLACGKGGDMNKWLRNDF
ncbi:hypothetical protein As57867_006070, partial [Aphanomyces stellatus]